MTTCLFGFKRKQQYYLTYEKLDGSLEYCGKKMYEYCKRIPQHIYSMLEGIKLVETNSECTVNLSSPEEKSSWELFSLSLEADIENLLKKRICPDYSDQADKVEYIYFIDFDEQKLKMIKNTENRKKFLVYYFLDSLPEEQTFLNSFRGIK